MAKEIVEMKYSFREKRNDETQEEKKERRNGEREEGRERWRKKEREKKVEGYKIALFSFLFDFCVCLFGFKHCSN